jgi:hypothetical protein
MLKSIVIAEQCLIQFFSSLCILDDILLFLFLLFPPTHPTFLFPRLKIKLKGRHFDTIQEIEAKLHPHRT